MAKQNLTDQLMAFFQNQPPEQVAQWLAETITADKHLKKQWQAKLLLASGKPSDYKKFLTLALPKKQLAVTSNLWRKVGLYFQDAEDLFSLAFEQLEQSDYPLNNDQQFTWLMQAFERMNTVLDTIDDSGGYRLNLVEQLSTRLIHCFHQLDWPLEKKASWLREHQFKYDVFPYTPVEFKLPDDLNAVFAQPQKEQAQPTQSTQGAMPSNVSMALLDNIKGRKKP